MWVCGSTSPGVTTLPPRSQTSRTSDAGAWASGPIHATLPPAMPIAPFATRPKGWPSCMVATVAPRSSRSNIGSADRHGLGERRQLHDLGVPGLELGMAGPPWLVGEPEVEIAQRHADGDLADGRELAERSGLFLERIDRALHLALLQLDIALAALVERQRYLAPARLGGVEDAVGQRFLGQCLPPRRAGWREELGRRADRVEILADHRAVVDRHAVVGDQGRDLGQRIE